MLDKFLEVAYTRTKEAEDKTRLVESMRKLPNELLMKIASGEEKLAFMGHGGESWLDKFKGSPLFGQAIQLEEQQLQLDMSNKQQWAAESAKRTQDDAVRDELCVKKKMLGLELAKQQEAQLQHEMTETPEDEAMESPEQQAMEQAQGMEMHPAPAAAAKMAEYLGKSAGAKEMYAGAKAGVKRYGQLLSGGNRKILEDSAIAPPALRFAPPALRDKLVKQERRSVNIARGATAGVGATAAGGAGYAATRKKSDDAKTASAPDARYDVRNIVHRHGLDPKEVKGSLSMIKKLIAEQAATHQENADWAAKHPVLNRAPGAVTGALMGGMTGAALGGRRGSGSVVAAGAVLGGLLGAALATSPEEKDRNAKAYAAAAKGMDYGLQASIAAKNRLEHISHAREMSVADAGATKVHNSQHVNVDSSNKYSHVKIASDSMQVTFAQMEKEAIAALGAVKGIFNSAKAGWGGAGAARGAMTAVSKAGPTQLWHQAAGAATNAGKYWQGLAKTRPGLAAGMVAAPALVGGAMLGRATAPAQQPPPRY